MHFFYIYLPLDNFGYYRIELVVILLLCLLRQSCAFEMRYKFNVVLMLLHDRFTKQAVLNVPHKLLKSD